MAVTYVTLYPPGGNSTTVQVVEGSQLHMIYADMGFSATPSAPGPPTRPDPFPQYVHDDEVGALVADAAVAATDPVVAGLVEDGGSQTGVALRAASVAALEGAATVAPTGSWDFDVAPTVNGVPVGSGGGSVPDATTTTKGIVELATTAETTTGTDTVRAVTPAGVKAVADTLTLRRFVDVTLAPYNAKGDGTTDDTTAIQAAIDACPVGGTVYLPTGVYKLSAALVVSKQIKLRGEGVYSVYRTLTASSGSDFGTPTQPPFLLGSILLQTAAGTNALNLTGSAIRTDLEAFGIRFADAIRHKNTGHGVYAVPTQMYTNGGTGHDHGLLNSTWRDVTVFGHDGNHYGFYVLNQMQCRWDHLQAYGGGGFYIECDSYAGNYGNLTATDLFSNLYVGGSAHGYALKGRAPDGAAGLLNLLNFYRVQCNVETLPVFTEITAQPTTSQLCFTTTTHNVDRLVLVGQDFEAWEIGNGTDYTCNGGHMFIDPSGINGFSNGVNSTDRFIGATRATGSKALYGNLEFKGGSTGAPTAYLPQAGAGTSPPAPVADGSNSDDRGRITFGTGTSPAAGNLLQVNWNNYRGGDPVRVMVTAGNAATAALGLYVTHDGGGFTIGAANPPAASKANNFYAVEYATFF